MEFLFTNQVASVEALIVFACILIIGAIFGYDGYLYLRRVWSVFFPKRITPLESSEVVVSATDIAPVEGLDAITPLPVETPEEPVILENPILYTETGEPITPEANVVEVSPLEESSPLIEEAQAPDDTDSIGHEPPTIESTPSETTTLVDTPDTTESPLSEAVSPPTPEPTDSLVEVAPLTETPITELPTDTIETPPEPVVESRAEVVEPSPEKPHRARTEKTEHTDHSHQKKSHTLSPAKREKLTETIANVRTLIARGHIDEARALIVSGLALEKNNRELNIIMASIYEREHAFEKAELILKDIALEYPEDIDILTHLATDLAMQHKYEVSYELYKKILSLDGEKEDILYTLTHLAAEMQRQEDALEYARAYLKQYPHNPEILWLYSQAQIALGQRREAVETLIKLKNLTPYNQEIADFIQKLVTEEELAGNFGGDKA